MRYFYAKVFFIVASIWNEFLVDLNLVFIVFRIKFGIDFKFIPDVPQFRNILYTLESFGLC